MIRRDGVTVIPPCRLCGRWNNTFYMPTPLVAYRHFQPHIFPIAIALITILIALAGPDVQQGLRYERSSIFAGEIWRLFTAHFVHLSWGHLLMNLAALGLIWGFGGPTLRVSAWIIISLASMASVSAGLLIFSPTLEWYVGLSGMLHGLLLAVIMANLAAPAHPCAHSICASCTATAGHRLEILLVLALIGKVAWEQLYGPLPGSAEFAGGAVVVDAHFYGVVGGLIGALPYIFFKKS
jgi:rhomboid family GlyGly-CTERM serine protease